MIDDVSAVVPHVAVAEVSTPVPESPAGEATLPAPTVEQAQTVDRVFSTSNAPHPISSMLGIATSILLLRDVAVDTFDTSGDEEEEEKKHSKDDAV